MKRPRSKDDDELPPNLFPTLYSDILHLIVCCLSVTWRLPLRLVNKQWDQVVRRSIRALEFRYGNPIPLKVLGPKFPCLSKVTLHSTDGLQYLPRGALTELTLRCLVQYRSELRGLSSFPRLRKLHCDNIRGSAAVSLSSDSLQVLEGHIQLNGAVAGDEMIAISRRLPNLRRFDVTGLVLDPVPRYIASPEGSDIHSFKWQPLSDAALYALSAPSSITAMCVGHASARVVAQVLPQMSKLESLVAYHNTQLEGIADSGITQLQELHVLMGDPNADTIPLLKHVLRNNPRIHTFHYFFAAMDTLSRLAPHLENIQHTTITFCGPCTDEDVQVILQHYAGLRSIRFGIGLFSGARWRRLLAELPHLERIYVSDFISNVPEDIRDLCRARGILIKKM